MDIPFFWNVCHSTVSHNLEECDIFFLVFSPAFKKGF